MKVKHKVQLTKWLIGFAAGISVSALSYYLIFRVALGVQFRHVAGLFVEIMGLGLVFVPLLYYLRWRRIEVGGSTRPFFTVAGVGAGLSFWIVLNHATKLRFVEADEATDLFWIGLVAGILIAFVSPYVHARLFKINLPR